MTKQPFDDVNDGPGLADFLPDVSDGYTVYAGTALETESGQCNELFIIDALRTVKDPEIPVNIYDLGLIYDIVRYQSGDVDITMSLTAPGCPVAGELPKQVAEAVCCVAGVGKVAVSLVWDPPWSPVRMSEDARLALDFG